MAASRRRRLTRPGRASIPRSAPGLASVALVSESITEQLEAKQELFHTLPRLCPPPAILTTNTSGLSITQLATVVAQPSRFAGMHFANPPHIIPSVAERSLPLLNLVEMLCQPRA